MFGQGGDKLLAGQFASVSHALELSTGYAKPLGQRPGERRGVLDDGIESIAADYPSPEPLVQLIQNCRCAFTCYLVRHQAGRQGSGHIRSSIGREPQFTQRTYSAKERLGDSRNRDAHPLGDFLQTALCALIVLLDWQYVAHPVFEFAYSISDIEESSCQLLRRITCGQYARYASLQTIKTNTSATRILDTIFFETGDCLPGPGQLGLVVDLSRSALSCRENPGLLHALIVGLQRHQLGAQFTQASDAEPIHQLTDTGICLTTSDGRGQRLLQALLFRREVPGIDTRSLQFGALIADLGLLPLELASGRSQGLLSLGVFPTQPLDRLAGLLDRALEIVDPLLGLEVGRTGLLGGLLGLPECINLAKRALNSLDQFDIFLAEFFGCTACLGSVGSQFDLVLGHGHSLRHLRKNRHG
ncbi:hypothetical protein D3C84_584600 [compost metagenome]